MVFGIRHCAIARRQVAGATRTCLQGVVKGRFEAHDCVNDPMANSLYSASIASSLRELTERVRDSKLSVWRAQENVHRGYVALLFN